MGSIGLDVSTELLNESPETLLAALASELEGVSQNNNLIVVDEITDLAFLSEDQAIIGFFSSCQRLCSNGTSIVMIAQSSAFDPGLMGRLHGLCNSRISLSTRMLRDRPGPYQIQAAIAALHAEASQPDKTDWPQIAALYGSLMQVTPSLIVVLNRAVAIAMSQGIEEGLSLDRPAWSVRGLGRVLLLPFR